MAVDGSWSNEDLTNFKNFNRNWEAYKWGFGDVHGEFWLGNQYLHWLTNRNESGMEVRFWGER